MDLLEYERYLQQQRQKKAIDSRLKKGVTRIGERIPQTDRYEVLQPDGSKNPNGIKIFTATHKIGDIVLPYPRTDGTIALDSYNAIEIPIEETPKRPEERKPAVWIFYEHAGKIWIGGHQSAPVEIGLISEFGSTWATFSNAQKLAAAYHLKCHVWGSRGMWVAVFTNAYQYDDPNSSASITGPMTLTHVENGDKKTLTLEFSPTSGSNPWIDRSQLELKIYPTGGGTVMYAPIESFTATTQKTRIALWNGTATTTGLVTSTIAPTENYPHPLVPSTGWTQAVISKNTSGAVPIPGLPTSGVRKLAGSASDWTASWGTATFTSEIDYVILSDGFSSFWIKEECQTSTGGPTYPLVFFNGATTQSSGDFVIRKYTLYQGQTAIKTQSAPTFFGIDWNMRASGTPYTQQMPDDFPASPEQALHYFGQSWLQEGITSCGAFRRSIAGISQSQAILDQYVDFPGGMPVTLVNGQVVGIPSNEIVRSTSGGGMVRRVARSVDGGEYDLNPVYVFPIPSDALIYHWCCDA